MVITPTAMVAGGDAIGRDEDGRVVFVAGALPGEVVEIDVVETRRDFTLARVSKVIEPSPLRVSPPCAELLRGCGGCQWQHIDPAGQRDLKAGIVIDALRRHGGFVDPPMHPTVELPGVGYRTSVRALVVDGRAGYRASRSHDLVPVDTCMVLDPRIEELLTRGRYGRAREVLLRCGARTDDRLVATTPADCEIDVPGEVDRRYLHEVAADRVWRVSARSFFQARPDGADALASLILGAAPDATGVAVDLYCGVGLFAGVLADQGWRVIAVEGASASVADARVNLSGADCTVVAADVTRWSPKPADFVVADPSRAGLRRAGVDVVAGTKAARVVLISCDAAAFGRDAGLLRDAGYVLTSVTPVDLFPHTYHVEVVGVFDC